MQAFLTLTRRELGGYLLSITGYIIISAAVFLLGFSFVVMLVKLQAEPTSMPVTELFYITPFFWLILLLSTPVITMRLFALEKFSGTFETLMTTPVSDLQVVLAKFAAAMVFYLLIWLPLLACLWIVRHYSNDAAVLDWAMIASTYIGIVLLGALFVSLGCVASALTQSQVTAAMISLLFGASLFLLAVLADQQAAQAAAWNVKLLSAFALFSQMHDFSRGVVDTRAVVLYVTLTVFFLLVTLRIVESRRWK